MKLVGKFCQPLMDHVPEPGVRKTVWHDLVALDVLTLLEAGDEAGALQRISEIVGFHIQLDAR